MKNKNSNNKGFSLVEALIAMAIISFVIVNILGGFSFQQMSSRKDAEKNTAILLADMRMQDLVKYNSTQLIAGVTTEFIVHKGKDFQVYAEADNPDDQSQFRRTTIIEPADMLGHMMAIRVMVEYGFKNNEYPFRVVLSTRRGL
ncbi:MAG: prepilin-type N-terminal cleavage/methylation domain-containing protein [Acidobacteria bacterium]|nr:prepilin-type N-terminal cleavage/methylation domain-containing protein [Acidobacteriota bacterium]